MSRLKLTHIEKDALREVMNVGTAHAMEAMTEMTGHPVMISVSGLEFAPVQQLHERVAASHGLDQVAVALFLRMLGDMNGRMLLLLSQGSADQLARMLLRRSTGEDVLKDTTPDDAQASELRRATLMEVGNIVANSYLNALSKMTGQSLHPSIPHFAEDMLGSVLDFVLIEMAQVSETGLYMETRFRIDELFVDGEFIVFPDPQAMEKILEKLRVR